MIWLLLFSPGSYWTSPIHLFFLATVALFYLLEGTTALPVFELSHKLGSFWVLYCNFSVDSSFSFMRSQFQWHFLKGTFSHLCSHQNRLPELCCHCALFCFKYLSYLQWNNNLCSYLMNISLFTCNILEGKVFYLLYFLAQCLLHRKFSINILNENDSINTYKWALDQREGEGL